MTVDEHQEKFDISDHNLIEIYFEKSKTKENYNKGKWQETRYYKVDEDSLVEYIKEMERGCAEKNIKNIEEFENLMKRKADEVLLKVYRRKTSG